MSGASYTPPLGFNALTPLYDRAIAALTRERVWRESLVRHLEPRLGERILDVGSGTGSLAVAVTTLEPRCDYRGIDPDGSAVSIAREKVAQARSSAHFEVGLLDPRPANAAPVDKVVCSLVLHQVSLDEKRRLLSTIFGWLKPGGELLVADYGAQPTLRLRLAFRLTVQMLDGKTDTQPNADGLLPLLIGDAGFQDVSTLEAVDTATGRIEIITGIKPSARAGER